MSDAEMNFIFTADDQMSDVAASGQETLNAMAAGPYEGELNIAASVDDNASAALDTIATNADQAASAMDQLASNQVDASAAMNDSAAASAAAGIGLGDIANGAGAADVSVRGATGGVRALSSLVRTVGQGAGMSTGSLAELSMGSRLLTTSTRLLSGGLESIVGLLAAIPAWGWMAAAAVGVAAASWGTNAGGIRNVAMQARVEIDKMWESAKKMPSDFQRAGAAIHETGKQTGFLGDVARWAEADYKAFNRTFNEFIGGASKDGAAINSLTAATERLRSANDNLKTAVNNTKTAQANYISAARGAEDANLRISTSVHSAEGAQIGLERATHGSEVAQQTLATMQASGTATADELWGAQMDVRDAALAVKTAQDTQTSSTTDQKRAVEDLPIATLLAALAFGVYKQAVKDQTTADNEARDAIANMQSVIDRLNGGGFATLTSEASANLQTLRGEIDATVAAQAKIDPTLRQSPSLVDKVELGVNQIMGHYKRLSDQSGAMPAASKSGMTPVVVQAPEGNKTVIKEVHIHPATGSDYKSIMRQLQRETRRQG